MLHISFPISLLTQRLHRYVSYVLKSLRQWRSTHKLCFGFTSSLHDQLFVDPYKFVSQWLPRSVAKQRKKIQLGLMGSWPDHYRINVLKDSFFIAVSHPSADRRQYWIGRVDAKMFINQPTKNAQGTLFNFRSETKKRVVTMIFLNLFA
ncbi:Alpha-amylase/alpha-mannosidase [Pseudomonas syringae pv. actinidiae]|uniref:Alpha-amylase/alpha-mannosidase n=1 Tax=Pseudomonas syringae pv. actinidiae TaxID=103796 RepID=A0A2V0QAC4_PSESF|nr:Alpha-amylase/alpha-mannosidase [Pseudomonas syringae pv. actinidiae]